MDATSEREDRYRGIAESRIREAMERGDFNDLKGAGQPVEIEDNPFVPEEWRVAFHVLKQNGFKPDWIVLGDEIEEAITKWRASADRHFENVRERLYRVASDPRAMNRLREEVAALKSQHVKAAQRHQNTMAEINSKINYFNATTPVVSLQRPLFVVEDEMRRFNDRLPAYLNY